jgi:hypothetical protein
MTMTTGPDHQLTGAVWNPTEKGKKRTALGFGTAGPIKPRPKPAAPAARNDKTLPTYRARLERAITVPEDDRTRIEPYIGAQVAVGWKMQITDGHRALLVAATDGSRFERDLPVFLARRPTTAITLTPAFHLALKRMAAAAHTPSKTHPAVVRLQLQPEVINGESSTTDGVLELSVRNIDDMVMASETLDVTGTALRRAVVALNIRYVDDVAGLWPMTLRIAGPTEAVSFQSDPGLVYVLMPFGQGGVDKDAPAVDPVAWEPWLEAVPVEPVGVAAAPPTRRGKKAKPEPVTIPAAPPEPVAPPPPPPPPRPAAPPSGTLLTWRYSWVEYKTKDVVSGEVLAPNEKAARAAIRAKHGFEKWLPDRTKVEAVA